MNRSSRPSPRTSARAVIALCAAAALAAGVAGPAATAARPATYTRQSEEIAPGLTLERIVDEDTPRRIFVLRLDPTSRTTLDLALAGKKMPFISTLSEIVKRTHAIAAVNGDFGTTGPGRPVHPFAMDGELVQTAIQNVGMFGVSRDGEHGFLGEVVPVITIKTPGGTFNVDRFNRGAPQEGEIAGFTPVAGELDPVTGDACAVRLLPKGDPTPGKQDGVVRSYKVAARACASAPLERKGGVVLAAQPGSDEAAELLSLIPGTEVRLHWTLGWKGVFDAIGGGPVLVWGGAIVLGACTQSVCGAAPRTGIGITEDGTVLLVVVDGRRAGWSIGPTLAEFAQIMLDLGAVKAMNLDGGGSSQMIVDGEIVNQPADDVERGITNAVVLLDGPDPGEPAKPRKPKG